MPTYEYRCKSCDRHLEVVQAFTDDALTTCEACGGDLRKVFGSVGIAFKGSGFYKTDSRGTSSASSKGSSSSSSDSSSSDSSTSGSSTSGSSSTSSDTSSTSSKSASSDAAAAS